MPRETEVVASGLKDEKNEQIYLFRKQFGNLSDNT